MQQLSFVPSRPAVLPRAEHIRLPGPLAGLTAPLVSLQQGYELLLHKLKQPSAEHPEVGPAVEKSAKAFALALRACEEVLLEQADRSKNMPAVSRVRDGLSSLWDAFDRYCIEATRTTGVQVTLLRSRVEDIFCALDELRSQHEQL